MTLFIFKFKIKLFAILDIIISSKFDLKTFYKTGEAKSTTKFNEEKL